MARTLIEEFKLENPQYKDVDDGVFKSVIISDFKSEFPQYKDMGDDLFAPIINQPEKTTVEKAAKAATDVTNKWWSYFENFNPDDLGSVEGVIGTAKAPFTTKSIDTPDTQRVVKDVVGGAAGTASGMLATIPATMKRLGISDEGENAPFEETAQRLDDFAKRMQPENPNFGDSLASGLASMATFFFPGSGAAAVVGQMPRLGAWAAKLAPLTGVAVSTIMESGTEAGQTYLDAKKEFGDIEAAHMAQNTFLGNVALVGLTNYLGGMFDPRIKGMVRRAFTQATTEGFQEGGQSIIQKVAQGKPIDWVDVTSSAGVGAITGGGMGMVTESFLDERTLEPETASFVQDRLPEVAQAFKNTPIPRPKEVVDVAIVKAAIAKQNAITHGADPQTAAIDAVNAFTKTLDHEPLVPQKKKAKGIIEYIKGWGGVDSTKEGGADFAELEIKGLVNDKNGKAPDHLVEKAIEDGFLPEQSTYNDLLALVEREQYSGPVLRQGDEAEGAIPERPLDSMSIESLDREIDRFQDMLGQGKAGKSIQLRLADLLEARKRRAQAEAEDMPDWVTEPLEGLEPDITPQKTVSSPTPGQMQGDAELARLARANQVEDDLIVSLVDKIDRNDVAFEEGYERKFDEQRDEIKASYTPSPGAGIPAMIHIAAGGKSRNAIHEFDHFAWDNLYTDQHKAILIDAFGDGKKAREDEADAMGLYLTEGTSGNSLVDKVFYEIKQFIERFGQWMKGRGFQSAHDIFKAIDGGKLGKRKARVYTERDVQFSVEPKNDELDKYFSDTASDILSSKRFPDAPIPVATKPSAALKIAGAHDIPIVTITSVITKARGKHGLTADQIQQIPAQLRDPVMVFESDNYPNSISVITEFKNKDGKPVDVQIHMDQSMGRGKYLVHKISSIGEREAGQILRWIKDGKLRYENTKKKTALFQSLQIRSLLEGTSPSKSSLQPDGLQLPKGEGASTIPETQKSVKTQFSVEQVLGDEQWERIAHSVFNGGKVTARVNIPDNPASKTNESAKAGEQGHVVDIVPSDRLLYVEFNGKGAIPVTLDELKETYRAAKNPRIQYSVERRAPTFFSAAEVILKEKMPNVAAVAQVKAILSGIKQEEVKWLGVEQFLEGKEKVSKAEMLDFVRANQVKVEEVMKSDGYVKSRSGRITPMDNGLFRVEYPGLQDQVYKTMEEATDELDAVQSRLATEKKETKFKSYQLPGGENYREMLLTLPEKIDTASIDRINEELQRRAHGKKKHFLDKTTEELYQERTRINDGDMSNIPKGRFTSSHFDEPNILAHVRFNERTGPKGERILFLEEVQSDWHQQGREKGYDNRAEILAKLKAQGIEKEQGSAYGFKNAEGKYVAHPNQNMYPEHAIDGTPEQGDLIRQYFAADHSVPDAPFKKTWHELALKRMLRYAAENGFDKLAWTTGEQQAERYNLANHVDSIEYANGDQPGTFTIFAKKDGSNLLKQESVSMQKLSDYVGKDVADKIAKDRGTTTGDFWKSESNPIKSLAGENLKVGGEGMRGFYDQILPSFLNKYAKKWGGRVTATEIEAGEAEKPWVVRDATDDGGNEILARFKTEMEAKTFQKVEDGGTVLKFEEGGKQPVHSLDITPSMKRDVLEVGQVQFSVERKDEPQVGQAIKAISDSIKAKEVGGDYTLGDGEIIKAEDLVDSMTLGEVTKEKAAGFLKAVKKGIHFLELPQNYLYAHEDSKPVAEGVIDAFVARERREHDIEEFKRVALSAPNPEALAEIVAAADRDNDVNIFAELTKAVKAGKITQADKEAFTKGLYFIHKAAKDQLIRDILASRVGVRIKSMGVRYLASYETKDGKAQERWLTGTQMKALEARGTKVTVLEEKEQIRIKRGSPEKGEIIESTRKVSSYDEALSILKEEEKQIIRELLPYRNYIPHARRGGKFWVEAYDQEGQKVYSARVPNESVAARMSELIGKEHPDWRIDAHPHSEKMRITPSFGSMADVQFFMNQNGIDPTSEPGQRIINAYRSVSPLMASLIHSQNIAGYKVDWDSIVDSMALMASSGSGRAYRLDVKDLMDDVKNIKDDFRFNTALQYVNALSEVQEDMPVVLQSIKSLTYFWLLANKSTYVIQNLTEPIWALARIESIKNPAGFAIVLNDEYKALLNRATEEGILKPFFSEQALAMNPLENLQKLDVLGRASEVWSSRKVFEIGLRLARDKGLRGNEAYRYAYQFLFNKGKPFYSTANKPIGMLGKGWAVNRQYGFMLLNFMFDWLGKFARGMLRNKLMTLMAWVLLGGFGTLPFGRKLMEMFKFQFEKNARNYDLLDRFMLGGIAGMLGISPSFIVPTVLKGIPLPSVNPFRSIDIIGNQIGFAAKSYEKYGIIGASGYLPLAGGQYILRGQARLKEGFKDNKKIIYRPRSNYEKFLVGAGLNPFEVNEYYRTRETAK